MSHPDLPNVEELMVVQGIRDAMQQAWNDSFIDGEHCCEQGGYIYAVQTKLSPITALYVVRAPAGKHDNQQDPRSPPAMSINLANPGTSESNHILVANFHTYPLHAACGAYPPPPQAPTRVDQKNSWYRKVPGILISHEGVYKYGEERRSDWESPHTYPPFKTDNPPSSFFKNAEKILTSLPQPAPHQREPKKSEKKAQKAAGAESGILDSVLLIESVKVEVVEQSVFEDLHDSAQHGAHALSLLGI